MSIRPAREAAHSIDVLPGMQCAHPGHTAKWHTRVCDELTAAIEADRAAVRAEVLEASKERCTCGHQRREHRDDTGAGCSAGWPRHRAACRCDAFGPAIAAAARGER